MKNEEAIKWCAEHNADVSFRKRDGKNTVKVYVDSPDGFVFGESKESFANAVQKTIEELESGTELMKEGE